MCMHNHAAVHYACCVMERTIIKAQRMHIQSEWFLFIQLRKNKAFHSTKIFLLNEIVSVDYFL